MKLTDADMRRMAEEEIRIDEALKGISPKECRKVKLPIGSDLFCSILRELYTSAGWNVVKEGSAWEFSVTEDKPSEWESFKKWLLGI